jgi:hypothetical protein
MKLLKSVVLIAAGVLGACATATALAPTSANPASEGSVHARAGPNGNTKLDVRLDHLPYPQALDPSFTTYVVWLKAEPSGSFVNMGQVAINEEREGRLETITPHRHFIVVVTAEADAAATAPMGAVMLRGDVLRGRSALGR